MKVNLAHIQVVGLGQACVDYLGSIPGYPEEDSKVELPDIHMQRGGPASTALVTLARLGIRTSFLGAISDDPFGRIILEDLGREGVDASFLKKTPGYSSQFSFIAINKKDGKRTIFWHRGTVPHLRPADVDLTCFPGARVFHTDGLMVEASIEGAKQAKDKGMTVVMDAGTMRKGYRELASLVDVLIASERFYSPLASPDQPVEAILESLRAWGPKQVIVTLGPKGSIGWEGRKIIQQKAFPVRARDTTGAGDVYHGAYVYGILQGWDMARCMRFSSAVSAIKCQVVGTTRGIPGIEDIHRFLEAHP